MFGAAVFHLHYITKLRSIVSRSDAEKLVRASVASGPNYCGDIFTECPNS